MADPTDTTATAVPAPAFDTEVNYDFHDSEYQTRLNLGRTLVGGAIATVTDAAASIWNSLPATPEVETSDLLKRINNDALQVYNENPDAIQGASFIAGSLVPFGLATKGMGMARAGSKGINWFSKAGKEADLASINKLFSEAGGATSEYRSLLRSTYAKGAANQALDAVAGEIAVVGLMHNHPLMEDYMQDPVKNFALSITLGSVIGGGIGHIQDRYAVKTLTGATSKEAIDAILGTLRDIAPDMTSGVALQSHEINSNNLANILKMGADVGKTPENDLAMSIAERARLSIRAQQATLFDEVVGPTIAALPKEQKDVIMRTVIDNPEMFGVEKVTLFTEATATGKGGLKGAKEVLTEKPSFQQTTKEIGDILPLTPIEQGQLSDMWMGSNSPALQSVLDTFFIKKTLTRDNVIKAINYGVDNSEPLILQKALGAAVKMKEQFIAGDLANPSSSLKEGIKKLTQAIEDFAPASKVTSKEVKSVYYPEFERYGIESDITNYGNAASLGKTAEQFVKELPFNHGKIPNLDSSLELAGKSSAEIDGLYTANKLWAEKLDELGLKNLTIGADDMPLLSAVITKIKEDPKLVMSLKVKIADRSPVFETIMSEQGQAIARTSHGLPVSYAAEVEKFAAGTSDFMTPQAGKITQFDPKLDTRGLISKRLQNILGDWIGGSQVELNKIALAGTAKGFSAGGLAGAGLADHQAMFGELYNSVYSMNLRKEFLKIADADGNVLLYRGSKAHKITHQNILESYTTEARKAAEFGNVRLYKVHVDNILAGWADIPGRDGVGRSEILVLPGARAHEAELSADLKAKFKESQVAGKVTVTDKNAKELYVSDLEEMLMTQKQAQIDTLLEQGVPMEAISLKTNTPIDVVGSYAFSRANGVNLSELVQDVHEAILTPSAAIAKERLDISMVPLRLEGNAKKNPYIEAHAALDNKQMKDISDTLMMTTMYGSNSSAAQELGRYFYEELKIPLDILKQELGKVNNELAGSKFLNSTDFWARNMGSVGPIVSSIGKQVQRISNDLIKRVVSPVSGAMSVVAKDPVSVVEFNTFVNVNSSLKGWRAFDSATGKLMQKVQKVDEAGQKVMVMEAVQFEGKDYVVVTPAVKTLINGMQEQSKELLALANTGRKIKGQADVTDIGLWIPSFNPVNKFIAYVHNQADDTTKMIWANNKEEFADTVKSYKKHLADSGLAGDIKVYEKGEQAEWNVLNGRLDAVNMERADTAMQKTGSASQAIVKSTLDVFSEIAGGYEHYITSQMRNIADLNLHEVTGMLGNMSVINQAITKNQPLSGIKAVINAPKDSALTMRNTLLGSSNLGEYEGWKTINQSFETGLSFALNGVSAVWNTATKPLLNVFNKKGGLTPEILKKIDYEQMQAELATRGIVNPWKNFDEEAAKMFGLSKLEDSKDSSKRIIYASNALAATVALRIGELAQPLVNILSLPVLTGLATASKMPAEFMGVQRGTANLGVFGGTQIMYEGARAANSPLWKHFDDLWAKQGHYSSLVSEASNVLRASRSFEKGAISKIENALDSNLVALMSKPADWSEAFVRRQTMFTGAVLAKRLYPDLSDTGITIFARDFMDKAVGNFHASQRPVFFQGTLGVALGLFQTYTLTLGQSIYRQLEMKNYKALGKVALTQSGIFGTASMPGFKEISTAIGDHFSDENVDLYTGTYRAIGNKAADLLLYGLPSNLGPSVYSRGDVSIRPPNILAGAQNTVAVSFVSQTMDMFAQIKKSFGNDEQNIGRSLAEALSMQSMSRPLARGSELLSGYSVTRKGNTVQTPEEVWTATGIFARVLGTRPLEEAKLREAMHLNTFYGSKDREARQELTTQLKTAIRGGELGQDQVDRLASAYMRKGGTPTGWRSALNTAIAQTDIKGDITFVDKLKPNNPLNYMINNLD